MASKLRVGIIGYGLSAKIFHIPYLQASADFVIGAVVARSKHNAIKETLPEATIYSSSTELFVDATIDVVIVATPPATHFELASQALKAGKHVVVEKPFAPTVTECDTLIQLAHEQQRLLTVYQNRRWDADFVTLRDEILPELGRIVEFESHFDRYAPDIDIAATTGAGTGVVFDLGTHLIDQALVLFGKPTSVTGFLSAQREGGPEGLMDACTVLLHYEAGPLVTIKASALSADTEQLRFWVRGETGSFKKYHLDTQEAQLVGGSKVDDADFGTEPLDRAGTLTKWQVGELQRTRRPNSPPKTYGKFYTLLASAIRGESAVPIVAEEARDVIKIVELATASSEKRVTLNFQ